MTRLLRFGLLGLAWISVGAALAGFVQPWALLEVKYRRVTGAVEQAAGGVDRLTEGTPLAGLAGKLTETLGRVVVEVKQGAETVTGELPELSKIPTEVSGIHIPRLANRKDAKVVLALAEMLTGQRELGVKSYAVYLVPGLALLCGLLLTMAGRTHREGRTSNGARMVCWLVALVCFGVAGAGFWKLLTTNTDTLLVGITIGQGLWLSLWAYVGLGIAAASLAVLPRAH